MDAVCGLQPSIVHALPSGGETEADVEDGFVVPPEGSTMISVTHRHGKADVSREPVF